MNKRAAHLLSPCPPTPAVLTPLERWQADRIAALEQMLEQAMQRIAQLEARLNLDSHNSHKPPSSDGLGKRPAPKPAPSLDGAARPQGGQAGHQGNTLRQVAHPDAVVEHSVPRKCTCGRQLQPAVVGCRQVFDLPSASITAVEHRVLEARCACGRVHRGAFPQDVRAPAQYGPNIKALAVALSQRHMVPLARTAELLGDLTGLPVSAATVDGFVHEAAQLLGPTAAAIGQAAIAAPVLHADETGMRAEGKLHWVHTLATTSLTWLAAHPRRGDAAARELGLLPQFKGTLVHDGLVSYFAFGDRHQLCCAHLLRELVRVEEEAKEPWARKMIEVLLAAAGEARAQPLRPERVNHWFTEYRKVLKEAGALHEEPPGGWPARRKPHATCLYARLRKFEHQVLTFLSVPGVPFTNNEAERALRMLKVKQKVAGCYRTLRGLTDFCTIRTYLATMAKQGHRAVAVLQEVLSGRVVTPALAGAT